VAIQPIQSVELYNTASSSADISSWYIDDAGGTTYFTIPPYTIIPPLSCMVSAVILISTSHLLTPLDSLIAPIRQPLHLQSYSSSIRMSKRPI